MALGKALAGNGASILKLCGVFAGTALVTAGSIVTVNHLTAKNTDEVIENPESSVVSQDGGASSDGATKKLDNNSASIKYSGAAKVFQDKKTIELYFENPAESRKDISLEIVGDINGEKVSFIKNVKLKPGMKVEKVTYKPSKTLEKGKYKGQFLLHFFNESGKEEVVASEVIIDVIIK